MSTFNGFRDIECLHSDYTVHDGSLNYPARNTSHFFVRNCDKEIDAILITTHPFLLSLSSSKFNIVNPIGNLFSLDDCKSTDICKSFLKFADRPDFYSETYFKRLMDKNYWNNIYVVYAFQLFNLEEFSDYAELSVTQAAYIKKKFKLIEEFDCFSSIAADSKTLHLIDFFNHSIPKYVVAPPYASLDCNNKLATKMLSNLISLHIPVTVLT